MTDDEQLIEAVARGIEVGQRVTCGACGRMKQPRGRSSAPAAAGGYCDDESCGGYGVKPLAGDLWPGESRVEFGFPKELVELRYEHARAALRIATPVLLARGFEAGRDASATVADTELEAPDAPDDDRGRLAQAAIRATKVCIAQRIRALQPTGETHSASEDDGDPTHCLLCSKKLGQYSRYVCLGPCVEKTDEWGPLADAWERGRGGPPFVQNVTVQPTGETP